MHIYQIITFYTLNFLYTLNFHVLYVNCISRKPREKMLYFTHWLVGHRNQPSHLLPRKKCAQEKEQNQKIVHWRQERSLVGRFLPSSCSDQKYLELSTTPLFLSYCDPIHYQTVLSVPSKHIQDCYGLNVCAPSPQIHMLKS